MEQVVGNCGKHPGQSMINCPLCAIEKMRADQISFTPAPWYPVEYGGYWSLQKEDFYSKEDDLLDEEKCKQATANAKLAAAAPEMYNMLFEASRILKTHGYKMVAKNIDTLLNELSK